MLATVQNTLVNASGAVVAAGFDPGVDPNGGAPWMETLRNITGMIMATCIVLLVLLLVVAVILLVTGKLSHHGGAQGVGITALIWGLVGAAVIGSLSGLVFWFSNMGLS